MTRLSTTVMMVILALSAPADCRVAAGDVSFRAADRTLHLDSMPQAFTIDVSVEVDGLSEVPSIGWGMVVSITPQANAVGTVYFNPPAIVGSEPNLDPASQNPFLDFDRDFGGMSYGALDAVDTRLNAFSTYIPPVLGPAPALDANGNLSLPHDSGLVALPLVASAGAAGRFAVTFDPDPAFTGVIFATGMPEPNDIGVHPTGQHIAGMVTIRSPGDYNLDGVVDAADYVLWRKTDGTPGGFDEWRANFGAMAGSSSTSAVVAALPEPGGLVLLAMAVAVSVLSRRR